MNSKEKEIYCIWNESWREYFLEKSYEASNRFYEDFYIQCVESIHADFNELMYDMPSCYNYFINEFSRDSDRNIKKDIFVMRFYKLVAMHNTIKLAEKLDKQIYRGINYENYHINWESIKFHLYDIFSFSLSEIDMAEVLYSAISGNTHDIVSSGCMGDVGEFGEFGSDYKYISITNSNHFQSLIIKVTARYLFDNYYLDNFSFAFIGNFWYNSYNSFIGTFLCYVPFSVHLEKLKSCF